MNIYLKRSLNTLLDVDEDDEIDYMKQEIKLKYNGEKACYTIIRDDGGNVEDVMGYHKPIKQIDEDSNISYTNVDELVMDDILNPMINQDYSEILYLIYEMSVNEEKEFTSKLIYPYIEDKEITFKIKLLECNITYLRRYV